VGVWPSRGVFYAHYDGEISRNRFVLMVALFWAVGRVYLWLAFVALVNGIASSFDLIVLVICTSQVPGWAVLRNRGWDTYWRPVVTGAAEPGTAPDRGGN
jgi:glucose uptake protein GlcU